MWAKNITPVFRESKQKCDRMLKQNLKTEDKQANETRLAVFVVSIDSMFVSVCCLWLWQAARKRVNFNDLHKLRPPTNHIIPTCIVCVFVCVSVRLCLPWRSHSKKHSGATWPVCAALPCWSRPWRRPWSRPPSHWTASGLSAASHKSAGADRPPSSLSSPCLIEQKAGGSEQQQQIVIALEWRLLLTRMSRQDSHDQTSGLEVRFFK